MPEGAHVWDLHDNSDRNVRAAAQMFEYRAIADRIAAEHPGGQVLDWGCGHGQLSALLAARGLRVSSFDHHPDGPVRRPLELFPEIQAYLSAEPVALPYPDRRFDAVLSCGVLEHVPDPAGSLAELRRVLRPDGTLYVYKLANRRSYLERLARVLGLYYHGKYPHDRLYTLPQARALLTAAGYRVCEIRRANMLPLTALSGPAGQRLGRLVWAGNCLLARVPGLNQFATNVEAVAVPVDQQAGTGNRG